MADEQDGKSTTDEKSGKMIVEKVGPAIKFVTDGLNTDMIMCDGIDGATFSDSVVKVNLFEERLDSRKNVLVRAHNATLVIPISAFKPTVQLLNDIQKAIEAKKSDLANE